MGQVSVRGIRGAITVTENQGGEICRATEELVKKMADYNGFQQEDVAAAFFTVTSDLNDAFPARAVREMGWQQVPLFCSVEIDVPGSLPRCIRVLLLVNTRMHQEEIKHVYLREARSLREDLNLDT